MNFKNWLLLTESIADLESYPPENLIDFIKNNITDGKSKSEKLIQFARTATIEDLYEGLIKGFKNGFTYDDLVKVPYDQEAQQTIQSEIEKTIIPYIEKNYSNIISVDSEYDGVFCYLTRKKSIKTDGKVKLYANFMPADKNASKAIMKLTDYYVNNLQFFRQAKFSLLVTRRESFVFYLSKEGKDQIEQINKDISSILNECGISHGNKPTSSGEDNTINSGNSRKSAWFSFLAIAPILGKDKIQELVNWIQTKIQDPNFPDIRKTNRLLPLFGEMSKISPVADYFKRIGIVVSGKAHEKETNTPSGSGDKLKLISLENNKEHIVDKRDEFGQRNLTDLLPMSVKFYASSQFRLEKIQTNWIITQIIGAKNTTNLNGIPLKPVERKTLKDGDVISIGKTQQGKLQVKL